MVLESLSSPFRAEKSPWTLLGIGALYASVGLFLGLWIFEEYAGLVMVFLTTLAAMPLLYHTLKFEEQKDLVISDEKTLLQEHVKAVSFYMCMFIGMVVAFTFWYLALPGETTNDVFRIQTQTISHLNQQVTGGFAQMNLLSKIFLNNVKVMIFCLLFSFIYGSGAIFIITWNASVIGVAAGNFIRSHFAEFAQTLGYQKFAAYFYVVGLSWLRYSIHGFPEVLAYVIAGIAGGILSVALIRHDFGSHKFERILLDTSDLMLLSIFILFIAAILEVFVTPVFF
ncbi:MAG: stage II sporulation protein M [Candidatus Aenigmarchaeota archaeon]|nr:stage II sporulation protein M [Candidatus Aenigmarchaeota archaeon]